MKIATSLMCTMLWMNIAFAQQTDTTLQAAEAPSTFSQENRRTLLQGAIAPAVFFAASGLSWNQRENIREARNRYIPTFHYTYDDYLQYAPAAAVYGLKLAGVKGRNNLGRTTLSYGASLAIMIAIVNGVKYTARVERPDGSTRNSFPSGHTSTAFTNATFLHKEYGLVNPAYSIGGYGAATFTGLGRNLNNRHWISDVLAGVGVGILSTELGYFFINKIYKNEGDHVDDYVRFVHSPNPSFLSLKFGTALATQNFLREAGLDGRREVGFEAGLEGAYFFTKNWGVGGDITFSSFPVRPLSLDFDEQIGPVDVRTESLGFLNFGVGPYYALDLHKKWQLQTKSTIGYSLPASGRVFVQNAQFDTPNNELELLEYSPSGSIRWNSGAAITYRLKPSLGLTLFTDYTHTQSTITYRANASLLEDANLEEGITTDTAREEIKYFTLGFKLTAFF